MGMGEAKIHLLSELGALAQARLDKGTKREWSTLYCDPVEQWACQHADELLDLVTELAKGQSGGGDG